MDCLFFWCKTKHHLGCGVLGWILRVKNFTWDGEDLKFHLHLLSCVSVISTVEPIDVGISHAFSFSQFSICSPSAHLPDKPSGLGGSGLQACQLWDYDMSLVVTRLQMSVLLTSNGGREGQTVLPALRIHVTERTHHFPTLTENCVTSMLVDTLVTVRKHWYHLLSTGRFWTSFKPLVMYHNPSKCL